MRIAHLETALGMWILGILLQDWKLEFLSCLLWNYSGLEGSRLESSHGHLENRQESRDFFFKKKKFDMKWLGYMRLALGIWRAWFTWEYEDYHWGLKVLGTCIVKLLRQPCYGITVHLEVQNT